MKATSPSGRVFVKWLKKGRKRKPSVPPPELHEIRGQRRWWDSVEGEEDADRFVLAEEALEGPAEGEQVEVVPLDGVAPGQEEGEHDGVAVGEAVGVDALVVLEDRIEAIDRALGRLLVEP